MKQIQLFKSLALFFAIYLPLVTVGIPLHKHYCNGILEDASLLFVADACQEESLTEVKKDCCSTGNSCHNSEPAPEKEEEKDCCETETELYKIDLTFITLKFQSQDNEFDAYIFMPHTTQPTQLFGISYIKPNPPPNLQYQFPSGKSRLIQFQQFLC
jgi:hypothetical protein